MPDSRSEADLIETTDANATAKIFFTMAGIIGLSALAFGVMSEERLATFAVSALLFVAAEESNLARRAPYAGRPDFSQKPQAALDLHPAVAMSAVIGAPDPDEGEVPVAFVVTRPGKIVSAAELTDFPADRIAAYKIPARIHFQDHTAAHRQRQDRTSRVAGTQRTVSPPY